MTTRKILSFFNRRTEYGEFVCGYLCLIRVRVRFIAAHPTANFQNHCYYHDYGPLLFGERTTRCLLRCGEIVFLVAMIDLPPVLPVPTQHFRFHCLRKQWSDSLKQERNISSSLPCPCSSRRGYDNNNNNKNRNDSNTYSAVRNNCRCKQIKLTQQITFKLFTCEVGSSTNVSEATIWMLSFSSSFRK